ncbi:MAG: DUF4129 domain-containing protein, partial [Geminicoccaceae bacterium]|nr:DUF4129 domain-containing protein [Geminicoccaceae bacterium]
EGFYGDLLDLLEGAGLGKPAWQPPLAFAASLSPHDGKIGRRVAAIAGLYYHARFAHQPPEADVEQRARTLLDELAADLAARAEAEAAITDPPTEPPDAGSSR